MNLGHLIKTAVVKFEPRTAIVEGNVRLTFGEFNGRINRFANSLIKATGLKPGDRVALLLNNRHEYMEARLALEKCGLVWVALNTLLAEAEILYILKDSQAKVLITEQGFTPKINRILSEVDLITVWVGDSSLIQALKYEFETLIDEGSPEEPNVNVDFKDLCSLNYTSGTTGKPKGAMLSHQCWINVYKNMLVDRDIRTDDKLAHIGPLTHASGSYFMPYFLKGATNVIVEGGFNLDVFLQTIEREQITAFTCVPTMIVRLLNYPGIKKYNLSSLRNIGYGAAPMPVEVIKKAVSLFGPILTQNYGQTEAYMTITNLPKEEHLISGDEMSLRRLSSVGRPYTFVEVRVVDEEDRNVPPGQPGELIVRSEHVMQGYWKLPEETAKVLKDGWLYTGDVATLDEQGYIHLVDRKKDMIISGGFNIYPREVEEILYAHPAIVEAAVIGVQDQEWGEKVKALVVLKPGAKTDVNALIQYCKDRIGFKAPRLIDFLPEIPKNATGKIDKKLLRQFYGKKLG